MNSKKSINENSENLSKFILEFNKMSEMEKLTILQNINDQDKLINIFNKCGSLHIKLVAFYKIKNKNLQKKLMETVVNSREKDERKLTSTFESLILGYEKEFDFLKEWLILKKWTEELIAWLTNPNSMIKEIYTKISTLKKSLIMPSKEFVDKLCQGKFKLYTIGIVEFPLRIMVFKFEDNIENPITNDIELWHFCEISELIDKSRPELENDEIYLRNSLISLLSDSKLFSSLKLQYYNIDVMKVGFNTLLVTYRSNIFKFSKWFAHQLCIGFNVSLINGIPLELRKEEFEKRSKELPVIFGTRFYPPLWIKPIPSITTESLLSTESIRYKENPEPLYCKYQNIEIKYEFDGFILVAVENLDDAYKILRFISISAFINGFLIYTLKRRDILEGRRRLWGINISDKGVEKVKFDSLQIDSIDSRRDEYFKDYSNAIPISVDEIKQIFDLALWLENVPPLTILLDLLQRAYTFYFEHDYTSCLINSWTIIEQSIEYIWISFLTRKGISNIMKKRMTRFPQWTTSSYLDSLHLVELFQIEDVGEIRNIKAQRDSILHSGTTTSKGYAKKAIFIALEILKKNLNTRGITQINLNKLREKLVNNLDISL